MSEDVNVRPPWRLLRRLCFWQNRKKGPGESLRTRIVLNNSTSSGNDHGYANNRIRTTKYTLLSFLPRNLFEQFHRIANLYFLGIVLLNWMPRINAFGKEIALTPVVFVLGVTAVKDWFEDHRRYKSDKRMNNLTCRVYSKLEGRYVKCLWKQVCVGDAVHLSCNEVVPADILLLRCSEEQGVCHIETASLDGETSLKQRHVPTILHQGEVFDPSVFEGRIECDPPNHKIYHFNGCITMPSGLKVPITKDNLLLKDCVVKNADFAEGLVVYAGHETKAMLNNDGPRYKRSRLEKLMNRDVIFCIIMLVLLCLLGAFGNGVWLTSFDNRSSVPFLSGFYSDETSVVSEAFLIFWTFVIVLQVMIPLSLYVTVELIKLGQVYFIHQDENVDMECRALNITEELGQVEFIFSDKTGTLTENDMRFRRCSIGGIDYPHHRNFAAGDQSQYDTVQSIESCDQGDLVLNSSLQEELCQIRELHADVGSTHLSSHCQRIQDFFLLMAVCNTVVVAKHPHKDQMNSSGLFLNLSLNSTPVKMRPKSIEGLGTHLLAEGVSSSAASSAASTPLRPPRTLPLPLPLLGLLRITPTPSPVEFRPIYEAESPDEIALVETAFSYDCRLLRRTPDSLLLSLPGEGLIEFRLLHVLPFDATRKRMSVILEHPITGEKILFCKGADSAILPHLTTQKVDKNVIYKTQQHLNSYSRKGLRVLCMAKKVLEEVEYEAWLSRQTEAELYLDGRERKLFEAACAIEKDLELLGATGIEDRLQEGVPRTLRALRKAGIRIWVLTGDKQETAVNIAYSCKLFSTEMEVITLNARSKETAEDTMKFYLDQIQKDIVLDDSSGSVPSVFSLSSASSLLFGLARRSSAEETSSSDEQRSRRALVVDGRTLAYILDKPLAELFLSLAGHCTSVLCCRATPLQKAYIVSLVKESLGVLTLAIGDGANDVSMIQTADVGVGVSGKEGMQAVMASDFTLTQFRHLERLLLVHGHWCYDRLARTALYFFYKNAAFIFLICWYQWYCGFSASVMIDQIYLMLYNVLFTSLPPLALGILDKDCPAQLLLARPSLYAHGRTAQVHTKFSFWVNMLDAIYQSVVTFFFPFLAYYDSDVGMWEFGTAIFSACVLGQLLHLSIETKSWTCLHIVSLFVSLLLYFGFAFVYNGWAAASAGHQSLQNPYWVIFHCMSTGTFWMTTIITPLLACLPRFIIRALQNTLCPSEVIRALRAFNQSQSVLSVQWSKEGNNDSVDLGLENQRTSIDNTTIQT